MGILLLNGVLLGQPPEQPSPALVWQLRAETFTAKVTDSSTRLKSLDKALVYSKLANIWWVIDRDRADKFYEKAVDVIFFLTSDEINADKNVTINTVGKMLVLIADRSPKQSKRLISMIEASNSDSHQEDKLNADALVGFAISLVKDNPVLAAEMGILALRSGQPTAIYELYWRLCRKDRQLASRLFDAMLRSANAKPTISAASSIKLAAFPELSLPNAPDEIRSTTEQRVRALEFLLGYLVAQRNKFDTKQIGSCANDAALVAPLLSQFSTLLPAQRGTVLATVEYCQRGTTSNSHPDPQLEDPSKVTVEALLRLAEKAEGDSDERAYYLFRAASLANDQEKFEQAIKILEGMSEAEAKSDRDLWDSLRYTAAANLAFEKIAESDYAAATAVVNKVPVGIRTFARIGLGIKCTSAEVEIRQLCSDQLDTGVSELQASSKGVAEKVGLGMHAIQKLAEFGYTNEALKALETVVKLVNSENSDNKKAQFHMDQQLFDAAVDADFLSAYDQSISSAIENLADPESKVNGLLSLVKTSVDRAVKSETRPKKN